jgi:hypothetical protein
VLPPAQLSTDFRFSHLCRCERRRTGVKMAGSTARDVVSSLVAAEAVIQSDAGSRNPGAVDCRFEHAG